MIRLFLLVLCTCFFSTNLCANATFTVFNNSAYNVLVSKTKKPNGKDYENNLWCDGHKETAGAPCIVYANSSLTFIVTTTAGSSSIRYVAKTVDAPKRVLCMVNRDHFTNAIWYIEDGVSAISTDKDLVINSVE